MLEELKELGVDAGYDAYRIKIGEGDQFGSDFVAINPNSKIPAMLDQSGETYGSSQLALLANRCCAFSRWWLWALLPLCT